VIAYIKIIIRLHTLMYINLFTSSFRALFDAPSFVRFLWDASSKKIALLTSKTEITDHSASNYFLRDRPITIIEARNIDKEELNQRDHQEFLARCIFVIASKELDEEQSSRPASCFLDDLYFKGNSRIIETIIVAKTRHDIIGFIIVQKTPYSKDTSHVIYLAVDSEKKKSGVGTTLLLTAMYKTKKLGKRYLTLQYIASGINEAREQTKIGFYNSFYNKFGIPTKETEKVYEEKKLYVDLQYDLDEIDFPKILEKLTHFAIDPKTIYT